MSLGIFGDFTSAAAPAALASLLLNGSKQVSFLGMQTNSALALGATVGAANVASKQIVQNYFKDEYGAIGNGSYIDIVADVAAPTLLFSSQLGILGSAVPGLVGNIVSGIATVRIT